MSVKYFLDRWYYIAADILVLQILLLYMFGQPWVCECGVVKVWEGVVASVGNSQQVTDWYTFSHIIHGFIFYALARYFLPHLPIGTLFLAALVGEVAWELMENTPMVIQHYRQQALAVGYTGDSILNSVSDVLAMSLGFLFASRVRAAWVVGIALAFELFTGFMIRDNLTLNVINLAYPFPAIASWQQGN
jgi:Protein of unknown function (DUF2585)